MKRSVWRTPLSLALLTPLVSAGLGFLATTPSAAAPPVAAVDAAALKQKLASLKGKVVVLNMWATWCGPCVAEFPELVKLDRTYRKQGVAVVGLSMDDPRVARSAVPQFTSRQKAGFPIYILKSQADAELVVQVFDPHWGGAIPMTYIFDRSGQLKTRITGARSLEGFEMAIKPMLTKAPSKQARR